MKFASIGDCCVDTYPDKKILGGTAYNSAVIAKKYGVDVSVISAIGNDGNGALYQASFKEKGIDTSHVQALHASTSAIQITLDESNSPIFGKWKLGALQDWILTNEDLEFIATHNIAKMICLKPLERNFNSFCETRMSLTLKAGDFDGNSRYSFAPQELVRYVDGLDIIVKGLHAEDKESINFFQQLAKEKKKIVLITLGEKGSMCFANDMTYMQDTIQIYPANTTGFGDAFLAVFLITYCQTKDIQLSLFEATQSVKKLSKVY